MIIWLIHNIFMIHIDDKSVDDVPPISWWSRLLIKISPRLGLQAVMRDLGQESKHVRRAHDLFSAVASVDVRPTSSQNGRGFMLTLDRNTTLYFYQDGDHFAYDGCEVGEYEKGDVRIFDRK